MTVDIVQIDSFTDQMFAGNPAAVCVLEAPTEPEWMQAVAREMNVSETSFLVPVHGGYDLRWFTPTVEVDLCGHATLAAAHHLYEHLGAPWDQTLSFFTASGELTATMGNDGWIELDFPAGAPEAITPPGALLDSLGLTDVVTVSRNRLDYLIEVPSADLLRDLTPDFTRLRGLGTRGVIVTTVGEGLYDFISRFFAPAVGVDEDPVTGSAHCALGPYWAERLGKDDLLAYQASPRGGVVRVGVRDDRVLLGGQAVTVMTSKLLTVPPSLSGPPTGEIPAVTAKKAAKATKSSRSTKTAKAAESTPTPLPA